MNFIGFFQSETYFKNIEDEIRKDFTFKKEIREDCQDIVEEYKGNISVHIRRNDSKESKSSGSTQSILY